MSHIDDRDFLFAFRSPARLDPARLDPVRVVVTVAPAVELHLSTDALVTQMLRLDSDADSTYVSHLLAAARKHFEKVTGLALINRTLRADFDRAPAGRAPAGRELELPLAPLSSISSIAYKPDGYTSGSLTTWASSNYAAGTTGHSGAPARLWLAVDASWPELAVLPAALQVTFVAGFGAAASSVPEEIRLAVLFLAAWWYESRLPVNVGNITSELPHHLNALIESHRIAFIA